MSGVKYLFSSQIQGNTEEYIFGIIKGALLSQKKKNHLFLSFIISWKFCRQTTWFTTIKVIATGNKQRPDDMKTSLSYLSWAIHLNISVWNLKFKI